MVRIISALTAEALMAEMAEIPTVVTDKIPKVDVAPIVSLK